MKRRHLWWFVLGGALVSVTFSMLYMFFGSWWFTTPRHRWAQVLLFPGLVTGELFYQVSPDWFWRYPASIQVGVATMGVVGGLIGLALHWIVRLARRCRRGPAADPLETRG